ncbi:potassium transporter [Solemya pervernicosa gill symbiont]|uniref:Trk system potassium uptake protein n=2 Tax=Gammaproteobacteria incertae sedis TaxID=118884 RepID=A0A1T2L868_9GAMM|nr:TrkH family potassium uptake protein [Candidatus Reidiella endopervernicosa]OOZ41260.1 potassium transporter [Solemya pervernicosa gill symbiont]QKQ25255.1 potassium transporter [Candidatus Reidiella endopervernicosa]
MQLLVVQRILGLLLMIFSFSMAPPILVGWLYGDGAISPFMQGFLLIFVAGLLFWLPVRHIDEDMRLRDGFVVVVLFWTVLGLSGAVPLALAEELNLNFAGAVFESLSGLTTTGATVLVGIDDLPHSLLFYRQQLQWLGGMGIIVLAVAVLPMLGVGGMQLYRAETPGPMKDNKLTPRITETAKALWYIYLGLTIACAVAYFAAGMDPFDAIAHSFSTVAIGGFSTHDMSMGFFNSALIESVAVVFMLLSGINFALHYLAWRRLSAAPYSEDPESRTYFVVLLVTAAITTIYLVLTQTFGDFGSALHHGIFQAVSIGTTTGFTTADYASWPGFLPVMLLFVSFIGGCAGSTGGGMKVMRFLLLFKQGVREIKRLVHPNAVLLIKVGNTPMPEKVVDAVWGFFAIYVASFTVMMLTLMATGLDQVTAFSAVAACMNNLGPGLGDVGSNYADISDLAKWVLSFAMLLGRLEIFTLLVLLTPTFWRK